jgi:spore maturation protein CgeB
MKVMMIAVFDEQSTNNSQADGFEANGCEVIRYNYRVRATEIGLENRDSDIIKICQEQRPHLVFFSKCNEVNIRVVIECNKVCKTVLWYMDPDNINFNAELIQKMQYSSYTCCSNRGSFNKAKQYAKNCYFIQEGFDHKVDKPFVLSYIHDVSFIGTIRNERIKYYDALKFYNYTNVFGSEHAKAVSSSKINLNFTDIGTSDRVYKILAAKGFLLTEPWLHMEVDFEVGKDLITFNGIEDLKNKIEYYINNDEERVKIAQSGYNTVQKFNRINYAKKILDIYEKIRNN